MFAYYRDNCCFGYSKYSTKTQACFSMLSLILGENRSGKIAQTYGLLIKDKFPKRIFISDFHANETFHYKKLLISLINKITPCKKVSEGIICYTFLTPDKPNAYSKNLILLSFIRNLWQEPFDGYSKYFFKELKRSKIRDPFRRLTSANKSAAAQWPKTTSKYTCCYGHSNFGYADKLQVRDTKDFLNSKESSVQAILEEI